VATSSYIEQLSGGLDATTKRVLKQIFDYVLKGGLRFGRAEHESPSENFTAAFFEATTDSVADTEFTIEHGFGRTPYLVIPVLPLDTEDAQIVPLKVTQAADSKRIYLSSPTTDAVIRLYVEG
jgi:hypothetical protein